MPSTPRRRIVRQSSFIQKLSRYPADVYDSLEETFEVFFLTDSLQWKVGFIAGIFATLQYALIRRYILAGYDPQHGLDEPILQGTFNRRGGSHRKYKSGQRQWINFGVSPLLLYFLAIVTWLAAIAFTVYIFSGYCHKKYSLFDKDPSSSSNSPNARLVTLKQTSTPRESSPRMMLNNLRKLRYPFNTSQATQEDTSFATDVWQLNIWDPSIFARYLLSTFSPIHLLIMHYPTYMNFLIYILLTGLLSLLSIFHLQQLEDKQEIYAQVMKEYNIKFVNPRLNVRKREVGIQCPAEDDYVESREAYTHKSGADVERMGSFQDTPLPLLRTQRSSNFFDHSPKNSSPLVNARKGKDLFDGWSRNDKGSLVRSPRYSDGASSSRDSFSSIKSLNRNRPSFGL